MTNPEVTLVGRSSSHFTRTARVFALELGVPHAFRAVLDMMTLEPGAYARTRPSRCRCWWTRRGRSSGPRTSPRARAAPSGHGDRVVLRGDVAARLVANAEELILHAMGAEVTLITLGLAAGPAGKDQAPPPGGVAQPRERPRLPRDEPRRISRGPAPGAPPQLLRDLPLLPDHPDLPFRKVMDVERLPAAPGLRSGLRRARVGAGDRVPLRRRIALARSWQRAQPGRRVRPRRLAAQKRGGGPNDSGASLDPRRGRLRRKEYQEMRADAGRVLIIVAGALALACSASPQIYVLVRQGRGPGRRQRRRGRRRLSAARRGPVDRGRRGRASPRDDLPGGVTRPCMNLECRQTTCLMGDCKQKVCAGAAKTTLSGRVYDPGGEGPALQLVSTSPTPRSIPSPRGRAATAATRWFGQADRLRAHRHQGRVRARNVPVGDGRAAGHPDRQVAPPRSPCPR